MLLVLLLLSVVVDSFMMLGSLSVFLQLVLGQSSTMGPFGCVSSVYYVLCFLFSLVALAFLTAGI